MDKKNKITALLLFIFILLIYLVTISPSVNFEDSGEFITSAATLSIAHPPGYPLYLILGKIFSSLPFGTIEFRINLMSAFFSALSAVVLYILLLKIFQVLKEKGNLMALIIVAAYFLSSTLWDASVMAEVYTLNLFLISLLLLLLERIFINNKSCQDISKPDNNTKYHYLFFYLSGVAFGNHQTVLFIAFIYFVFFIKSRTWQKLKAVNYIKFIFLFILGISIYAYLPIRAGANPIINWGSPDNLKNFLAVLSRQQYGYVGKSMLSINSFFKYSLTVNPLYEFFKNTETQINIRNIVSIFLFGIIISFLFYGFKKIKNSKVKLLFTLLFLLYTFFIILIASPPEGKLFTLKVFFIPGWLGFYFIFFYGIFKMFKKYSYYLFALLLIGLLFFNFRIQNKNKFFYTDDYAKNILKDLKYRAILFTFKDNETFPLWDMKYVRTIRPDISLINLVILSEQWYLDQLKTDSPVVKIDLGYFKGDNKKNIRKEFVQSIIRSNPDREVYFTSKRVKEFIVLEKALYSSGILYKLNKTFTPPCNYYKFRNLEDDYFNFLEHLRENKDEKFKSSIRYLDTQTKFVLQQIAFSLLEYANNLLDTEFLNDAVSLYQYSMYLNNIVGASVNNIYAYINIGNIFSQKEDRKQALYFFKKGIELQPESTLAKKAAMKINNEFNKEDIVQKDLSLMAENYYKKGNYQYAIKYYKKMLEHTPDNPTAYGGIGDCYFNMKNYSTAIKYYNKAIKIKKDYANAYYNLGGCYITLGKKTEA